MCPVRHLADFASPSTWANIAFVFFFLAFFHPVTLGNEIPFDDLIGLQAGRPRRKAKFVFISEQSWCCSKVSLFILNLSVCSAYIRILFDPASSYGFFLRPLRVLLWQILVIFKNKTLESLLQRSCAILVLLPARNRLEGLTSTVSFLSRNSSWHC